MESKKMIRAGNDLDLGGSYLGEPCKGIEQDDTYEGSEGTCGYLNLRIYFLPHPNRDDNIEPPPAAAPPPFSPLFLNLRLMSGYST